MVNQFSNIELYKYYLFFEYLKMKFPPDGVEKIDVSDLVDLESLNLDVKGNVNISLQEEDTIFDPNNPGSGKIKEKDQFELLSEILQEINEFYGKVPEGTEEGSKKLIENLVNDIELKEVLLSDNTFSNKKDKLEKIYNKKNIKTLDTSTKLYEIFDKKEMKDKVINTLLSRPDIVQKFQNKS